MDIKKVREELFDDDFRCKTTDAQKVFEFCEALKDKTGILVGNKLGMMYEYLPKVYRGAIKQSEM